MKPLRSAPHLALVAWVCLGAGCYGGLPETGEPTPPVAIEAVDAPGPVSMRKLTQAQLRNVVADLFGDEVVLPPVAEPDVELGGLLSVGASSTTFSARGVESLEDAAYAIAEQALATPAGRARIVPCQPAGKVDAACAGEALAALGRLAWRRPLSEAEVARVVAVSTTAAKTLGDFYAGLEFGVAALLQSTHFLYRTELGEDDPERPGARRFTAAELAGRLSFFLWNTMPDAELLDAAERGELETTEGLLAQVDRLLASPRARAGLRNFFSEYLGLLELDELTKDPTVFEHWNTALGPDAREETLAVWEHTVFDADGDYRDLMTSEQTFVNPRLAAIYGIPTPVEGEFGAVRLPAGGPRAGLLGQLSFLGLHAHAVSSSATRRGLAVRETFLCETMPSAPVDVDTSIPEPSGTTRTLRDRVAEHLENEACAFCHLQMDPIGLALENFDGLGRWRDTDHGAIIDASGDLDGRPFTSLRGLGEAVRAHPNFPRCLVQMMGRYATGRVESAEEHLLIDALNARFAADGFRVKALVRELVASPLFRTPGPPE